MDTQKDQIIKNLQDVIAGVYETESGGVDIHTTFLGMGLDSISIIQVKQLVKNEYGFEVPVDRLFDDVDNLDRLADFIREKLPPERLPAAENIEFIRQPRTAPVFVRKRISAGDDTDMKRIINDQIQVMHRQIEILSKMSN